MPPQVVQVKGDGPKLPVLPIVARRVPVGGEILKIQWNQSLKFLPPSLWPLP